MGLWRKLFPHKCFICGMSEAESGMVILKVIAYGFEYDKIYKYHKKCLCEVLEAPESYPKLLGKAISCAELIENNRKRKEVQIAKAQKLNEELCI